MIRKGMRLFLRSSLLLALFALWTLMIQTIDVQRVGQHGTAVGFATLNCWFHRVTGTHMLIYHITDWLGLVPVFVCMGFGCIGLAQLIRRRNFLRVDRDILWLGVYYVIVIFGYLIFEMIPVNYRPVLIDGFLEASYPSSTTLLVLSVMPTLIFQVNRRVASVRVQYLVHGVTAGFSLFMVIGRLISGVHWLTDIIGSVLLSAGLFCMYRAVVLLRDK